MVSSVSNLKGNVKRVDQITRVLAKYGLADMVGEKTPGFIQRRFVSQEGVPIQDYPFEVRVRLALTELGTTFIKLGQMMSTRADMVGPDLATELQALQADTPADPPEAVRATIVAELGAAPEEIFAAFDMTALASASVGEVHQAQLEDGTDVVVKVQHAGIEEKVRSDLSLMNTVAQLAEKNSRELAYYRPTATVIEFRRSLLRELDFHTELSHLVQFRHNFAKNPRVEFPKPYAEFSSRRVLTMARIDGYSIAKSERMDNDGINRTAFAKLFADTMLDMIFRDGFYHADPHPGNVFVLPGGRLGMLDCGKVGRVDEQTRDDFLTIVGAFLTRDVDMLTEELTRLCDVPLDLDRKGYRADVADFVGEFAEVSSTQLNLSAAFESMFGIIRRHHLTVPARVNMLLLVVVQTEGTARMLDPQFNLVGALSSHGADLVRRRFAPNRLQRQALRSFGDWSRLLNALPRELLGLLERTQRGELQIHVQQHGLQGPLHKLTVGILTAALLLGSALLWAMSAPPTLFGVSVFGALGAALALAIALYLFYLIWRAE